MDLIKAHLPNFIKVTQKGKGLNEGERISVATRLNPYHITAYHESFLSDKNGGNIEKVVTFYVGGVGFNIEMTIEEADEMMDDIDRSLSFKENE